MTQSIEQLELWIDRQANDLDGHRIGMISDVYVDDATGVPEWLAVMTGLFGSRISFVPLVGAREEGEVIRVPYEKSLVKDSPNVEADGELSEEEEERLYRHFGLPYRQTAGIAAGKMVDVQQSGAAVHVAHGEPSVESARRRLRRRDEAAVRAIDLRPEEVF